MREREGGAREGESDGDDTSHRQEETGIHINRQW